MVHMKILEDCGLELKYSLRSRFKAPFFTEEYNNALEEIVKRARIGRTWEKMDIKTPIKPFIRKEKPKEPFKPNKTNEQKNDINVVVSIWHLANTCLKKTKINEIVETEDHNDKEGESYSEKDTEESHTCKSDENNIISSQMSNIDLIYQMLDVKLNLPQTRTSNTFPTIIIDSKLHRAKPAKVMGYTSRKSGIRIFMLRNQEARVNLDTGEYFTCAGKNYLQTLVPDWENQLIPIQGVRFSSVSESMKHIGIIDFTFILPHPS
ncbi:hypothetical protein O181_047249 [Austropuccinia psidii MF-1]|uniref:Uncharacterized protein n=1 Tax=Austropuccinia psidii MF-1 TaxID=1389203 RepID=A0A9Q3HLX4_9BASI|nr:hypothetical protein [Austropuccinia psidii MF-1]